MSPSRSSRSTCCRWCISPWRDGLVSARMPRTRATTMRLALSITAIIWLGLSTAHAAPCMTVTITGAQGGPQADRGQAGPGTLVQYGDDSNNCGGVRLQFDAGRGTLLRLSQLEVLSSQVNAVFLTHMHND